MDSKPCGGIDLHIHSTASDGTYTSSEILHMAERLGLEAISITDHDTLDGSRQALACEIPSTLQFITGVEISTEPPPQCKINDSLHILGYGIDLENPPLNQALADLQIARNTRTQRIVEKLNQLGFPLTLKQVLDEVGQGSAGRPHVANVMIKAGIVTNVNEAFDRYLAKGCPAYVGKDRLECRRTFELIRAAGGVPVLAHPYLIQSRQPDAVPNLVKKLCEFGLKGLEAHYPNHTPEAVSQYLKLARRYDLLVTGGSDFHGDLIPDIQMGRGKGNLYIPYELYEALLAKCSQQFKDRGAN